jgi:pilus assembly protein CpaE
MADRISTLVAAHGRVDLDAVRTMIASCDGLELAGIVDNDIAWSSRADYRAQATVVACSDPASAVLDLVQQEALMRPHMPVVVVCATPVNGFVRKVFEAGADDIVIAPSFALAGDDVYFAIQKALTRKAAPQREERPGGDVICVLGPKGGTGKTLTSSNLACALAQEGKRVALVDLDLQFGDLGLVMGTTPTRSIFDLATAGGSLDAQKVEAFLLRHESGVRLLLAPTRPDHASAITPEFLRDVFAIMRKDYDYVVVDTPPGFTAEVIAAIDSSSAVCLIGTLDAPSLKNAKLGAETLELMGYPADRVRIVLNRADASVGVSHADVVTVLGRAPDVLVPSTREIVRSVNAGTPIVMSAPRSEAAKSFRALARLFGGAAVAEPEVRARAPRKSLTMRVLARS